MQSNLKFNLILFEVKLIEYIQIQLNSYMTFTPFFILNEPPFDA